jgi:hypothetical protein
LPQLAWAHPKAVAAIRDGATPAQQSGR